jgi:hypothetical protein
MRLAPNLHRVGSDHVDSYLVIDAGGVCRLHGQVCGVVVAQSRSSRRSALDQESVR